MTTWNNIAKNSSSFSNISQSSASSYTNTAKTLFNQFLLQENGAYLLLEDGGRIILEQSILSPDSWINETVTP